MTAYDYTVTVEYVPDKRSTGRAFLIAKIREYGKEYANKNKIRESSSTPSADTYSFRMNHADADEFLEVLDDSKNYNRVRLTSV